MCEVLLRATKMHGAGQFGFDFESKVLEYRAEIPLLPTPTRRRLEKGVRAAPEGNVGVSAGVQPGGGAKRCPDTRGSARYPSRPSRRALLSELLAAQFCRGRADPKLHHALRHARSKGV